MLRRVAAAAATAAALFAIVNSPVVVGGNDSEPDWLFVHAAWNGTDPYSTPWSEMSDERVALDYGTPSKTPAVAVAQAGWLLVPFNVVPEVAYVSNTAAIIGVCWLSARIAGRRFWWWLVLPVVALWPVWVSYLLGNPIFVWAFLILATWRLTQTRGDAWWVGVPLGVATSVRLWPALLVVALWAKGYRRVAVATGGVAVGLNAAGLAAPGITLTGAASGLVSAGAAWGDFGTNSSLVRLLGGSPLILFVLVVVSVVVVYRQRSVGTAAVLAVLVSPVSWMSYYLVAGPVFLRHWPVSLIPLILIGVSRTWWAVCVGGLLLFASHMWSGHFVGDQVGAVQHAGGGAGRRLLRPLQNNASGSFSDHH